MYGGSGISPSRSRSVRKFACRGEAESLHVHRVALKPRFLIVREQEMIRDAHFHPL